MPNKIIIPDNSPDIAESNSLQKPPSGDEYQARKQGAIIGSMNDLLSIKSPQSIQEDPDCITAATRAGRMLSGKEVAVMFGYKNRASFWSFCAREGIPLCRLSSHTIRFPVVPLQAWIQKRSNTGGRLWMTFNRPRPSRSQHNTHFNYIKPQLRLTLWTSQ